MWTDSQQQNTTQHTKQTSITEMDHHQLIVKLT